MTDGDGQPVNALYGFGRFLGDLLEEAKPEHVAVAFDESPVELVPERDLSRPTRPTASRRRRS